MEIPKEKSSSCLRSRGDQEKAKQADQELPENADPDREMELLSKYGVEPTELLGKLGGGNVPGL